MNFQDLRNKISSFLEKCPENYISKEDAIRPDLAGMRMYDAPLFGIAAADDPMFKGLRSPEVIGLGVLLPHDWLPEAKSVLSFFLPFTEQVRRSNRLHPAVSDEWLHCRIEGQMAINALGKYICDLLQEEGFAAVYPAAGPRFNLSHPFASNWSERHAAHICGLGTFSLSKSLITEKGCAGRLGSVITSAPLPVTKRPYDNPFAYCTMCGKCQDNCPANAIDMTRGIIHGKDHVLCSALVNQKNARPPHGPHQRVRFGCGKCQVGVPCENCIP